MKRLLIGGIFLLLGFILFLGCKDHHRWDPYGITRGNFPRYRVKVLQEDFDHNLIPPRYRVDFDDDGMTDKIEIVNDPIPPFGRKVVIELSNRGHRRNFEYVLQGDLDKSQRDLVITDYSIVSARPDGRYPSIVLAIGKGNLNSGALFAKTSQIVLSNHVGNFYVHVLPNIELAGRGVDCVFYKNHDLPICFFASYAGNSTLVELSIAGRYASAIDITQSWQLPFPFRRNQGPSRDGFYMIGGAFFDLNKDGKEDLVAVGQHSKVFAAFKRGYTRYFRPQFWFREAREYLRVSAPRISIIEPRRRRNLKIPTCVYMALERNDGRYSDHLECFYGWIAYEVPLKVTNVTDKLSDEQAYNMRYEEVRFFDYNRDNMIDFAAKNAAGKWTLFTYEMYWPQITSSEE